MHSRKMRFLCRWAVYNTPIEKRFYATLSEKMERVTNLQDAAKTQLDHPLGCSLDYSRRGSHTRGQTSP